jgi:hypothetical protein
MVNPEDTVIYAEFSYPAGTISFSPQNSFTVTTTSTVFNNADGSRAFKMGGSTGASSTLEFFDSAINLTAKDGAPTTTPSGGSQWLRYNGGGGSGRQGSALYIYDEYLHWLTVDGSTKYSASLNPPSMATGAAVDVDTGITLSSLYSEADEVQGSPESPDGSALESGLIYNAYIDHTTRHIVVRFFNGSGSTLDPMSRMWRFSVRTW